MEQNFNPRLALSGLSGTGPLFRNIETNVLFYASVFPYCCVTIRTANATLLVFVSAKETGAFSAKLKLRYGRFQETIKRFAEYPAHPIIDFFSAFISRRVQKVLTESFSHPFVKCNSYASFSMLKITTV